MLTKILTILAVLFVPVIALAQASLPSGATDLPVADAFAQLVALLATLKGATALTITVVIVQALMLILRTPLADKLGKWKLTALLGLTCLVSLFSAKLAGASWGVALLSGPLLAAAQNFAHQLFTQFSEKKDPVTPPA